ncbi:MAG: hypothetical protein ACLVJH_13985 [Faecalibacterium prausnitzii]
MKRIYACILIVAALLGVSLYSSGQVQGFAQDDFSRFGLCP